MADDPRQIRTRAALTNALLQMLHDESLASISVAGLCQAASVHRTTFYKHAASIEEFAVEVAIRELDATATVEASSNAGDALAAYGQAMVDVFRNVSVERALYRPLLASPWGGALRVALDARMRHRVGIALDVFAGIDGVAVPEHRDDVIAFISGGLVGMIVHWVESDDTDAEIWAARTQAMMPAWWPVR